MKILSSIRSCLSTINIDFMKVHKLALFFSIFSIIASLTIISIKGLNFGIDFAGGILIEARSSKNLSVSQVRQVLSEEVKDVQIQNIDKSDLLIRVAKTNEEQSVLVKKIQEILSKNFPDIEYRKVDYVGPQIGAELIKKGFFALFMSCVFIMIYIWIRFDWQFGVGGILALLHDSILTLGFFSLSGLEFNLTSIAAMLTIIGYSINDSVVIYDRIRENLRRYKKMDLSDLINSSLNSTLSRTILTASTTLFSLASLILFGGEVLKSFSLASFVGILIGTYSSIYISAPILLYFKLRREKEEKTF